MAHIREKSTLRSVGGLRGIPRLQCLSTADLGVPQRLRKARCQQKGDYQNADENDASDSIKLPDDREGLFGDVWQIKRGKHVVVPRNESFQLDQPPAIDGCVLLCRRNNRLQLNGVADVLRSKENSILVIQEGEKSIAQNRALVHSLPNLRERRERESSIEDTNRLAVGASDRLVAGDIGLAENLGHAKITLTPMNGGESGAIGIENATDGARSIGP